jgi:hypothetical protein
MKFRYLPNVFRIHVRTVGINPFAVVYGIEKKRKEFEVIKFKDLERHNLYLRRQYSRLYKLAVSGDYKRYEELSLILIKSSKIYQISMLHHASRTWYCKSLKQINIIWRKIRKNLRTNSTKLNYERWWIDKLPNDAGRPLVHPKSNGRVSFSVIYKSSSSSTELQAK